MLFPQKEQQSTSAASLSCIPLAHPETITKGGDNSFGSFMRTPPVHMTRGSSNRYLTGGQQHPTVQVVPPPYSIEEDSEDTGTDQQHRNRQNRPTTEIFYGKGTPPMGGNGVVPDVNVFSPIEEGGTPPFNQDYHQQQGQHHQTSAYLGQDQDKTPLYDPNDLEEHNTASAMSSLLSNNRVIYEGNNNSHASPLNISKKSKQQRLHSLHVDNKSLSPDEKINPSLNHPPQQQQKYHHETLLAQSTSQFHSQQVSASSTRRPTDNINRQNHNNVIDTLDFNPEDQLYQNLIRKRNITQIQRHTPGKKTEDFLEKSRHNNNNYNNINNQESRKSTTNTQSTNTNFFATNQQTSQTNNHTINNKYNTSNYKTHHEQHSSNNQHKQHYNTSISSQLENRKENCVAQRNNNSPPIDFSNASGNAVVAHETTTTVTVERAVNTR